MPPPESAAFIVVNESLLPIAGAHISALDRGFTLSDGLFETMRARDDHILLLDAHLARLRAGAAVLELALPHDEALRAAISTALRANPCSQAVVRLTVTRGADPGRGLEISADLEPTVVVRVTPVIAPGAEVCHQGVSAVISHIRRNESSPLSRVKSLTYGDNILARRAARRSGADEALLLNTRGDVACAAAGNVLMVCDGTLYTPPVESGVLAGITRGVVLEAAAVLGMPTRIEPFSLERLRDAREVFLTNTVAGVLPLTRLDGHPIDGGSPGTITTALAADYARRIEQDWARSL